jgi:type 1 fimbria pilin
MNNGNTMLSRCAQKLAGRYRGLAGMLVFMCLLAGAQVAQAACFKNPAYTEKTINMFFGKVYLPSDLAVGALIARKEFNLPLQGGQLDKPWNCTNGGTVNGDMLQGQMITGYDHVYSTNVTGIGVRLSRYFTGVSSTYYAHTRSTTTDFGLFDVNSKFVVELFKTGPKTGSGPLAPGIYTKYYSVADNLSVLTTYLDVNAITIVTPTCTVDVGSKNIAVNLGSVSRSNFKGVGSSAGEKDFNIKLNCQRGENTQNIIALNMAATSDPANKPGVLQLTQEPGVATGVGIQVLDQTRTPVKFTTSTVADTNSINVGPSDDIQYVVPFKARYYQTTPNINTGKANGTATFTIVYQ